MVTHYFHLVCRDINQLIAGYLFDLPTGLYPLHGSPARPKGEDTIISSLTPLHWPVATEKTIQFITSLQTYADLVFQEDLVDPFRLLGVPVSPKDFPSKFTLIQQLRQSQCPGWEISVLLISGFTKLAFTWYDEMKAWSDESPYDRVVCPYLEEVYCRESYLNKATKSLQELFRLDLLTDDQLSLLLQRDLITHFYGQTFSLRISQEISQQIERKHPQANWSYLLYYYGEDLSRKLIDARPTISPTFFFDFRTPGHLANYRSDIVNWAEKIDYSLGLPNVSVDELTRQVIPPLMYNEEKYPDIIPVILKYYRRCLTFYDPTTMARRIHRVITGLIKPFSDQHLDYYYFQRLSDERKVYYLVFLYDCFFRLSYDGQALVSQLTQIIDLPYGWEVIERIRPHLDHGLAQAKIRPGKWLRKHGLCL